MRVSAGELKGRKISSPSNQLRPTSSVVREAIFDSLDSIGILKGSIFVDLFAGTGTVGIEALSRGATFCAFVDLSRVAISQIRSTLESLKIPTNRYCLICEDFEKALLRKLNGKLSNSCQLEGNSYLAETGNGSVSSLNCVDNLSKNEKLVIVFADPPYVFKDWIRLLNVLKAVNFDTLVIESSVKNVPPNDQNWRVEKKKKYGDTLVQFLVKSDKQFK